MRFRENMQRAKALLRGNRTLEAEEYLERATRLRPENQSVLNIFLETLANNGRIDRILALIHEEIETVRADGKMAALFLGNCQSTPLREICMRHAPFQEHYAAIRNIPLLHTMPAALQQGVLQHVVGAVDVVLTQNIMHKDYPLRTVDVRSRARALIVYPTCFFSGYHPDAMFLKDAQGRNLTEPLFGLHSAYVFTSYISGTSPELCARDLCQGTWLRSSFIRYVAGGMRELRRRERHWDVTITDYLRPRYTQGVLFHTINHPAGHVLQHIADQIMERLGLGRLDEKVRQDTAGIMAHTQWLFPPKIAAMLGMPDRFCRETFLLQNKEYSPAQFVEIHYAFYEAAPDIVALNRSAVERRMRQLTTDSRFALLARLRERLAARQG